MNHKFVDFGPFHQFISDTFFEGNAWIYNGAACQSNKKIYYVCRARDMRDKCGVSHIVCQTFDRHFLPISVPRIIPNIQLQSFTSNNIDTGPQDARIFEYQSCRWIIFNMLCADGFRRMHLYNVTLGGKAQPLCIDGKDISKVEKNWTPLVFNGKLLLIYSFVPLVLLQFDSETGMCKVVYASRETPNPIYRGGCPAIALTGNVFVGWLHTTKLGSRFDPIHLPIPARKTTPNVYRTHKYELTFQETGQPILKIDKEQTFFGNQIEQIYGQLDSGLILNVDDRYTIYVKNIK